MAVPSSASCRPSPGFEAPLRRLRRGSFWLRPGGMVVELVDSPRGFQEDSVRALGPGEAGLRGSSFWPASLPDGRIGELLIGAFLPLLGNLFCFHDVSLSRVSRCFCCVLNSRTEWLDFEGVILRRLTCWRNVGHLCGNCIFFFSFAVFLLLSVVEQWVDFGFE